MQTPPLSARVTQWRVTRVLAVTLFLAATIASSLSLAPRAAEAAATNTTTALNLRSGPGTKYDVILVMPSGASLKITGSYSKGFYPVRYQGIKGWAAADYLGGSGSYEEVSYNYSSTGTAYTTTSLNLRSGPSTGDSVITVMRSGAAVTLTGQSSNGFVSVDYNGSSGWAYEDYLGSSGGGGDSGSGATDSATGTAYTTTSVNLRSGAGTSYSIITVVPSGASVSLTGSTANNFVSVSYNGSNGWLYADYVSSSGGGSSGSGSGSTGSTSGSSSIIDIIYEAAAYYGQNGDDMLRVARCESNLDPNNVTPPYQASGLFQFLPSTWASTPYADQDIFDPVANAYAAAWMWSVGRRGEWVCQ